ncbi:hypothetical protein P8625_13075 [Tenacibaculum tangerinum]|uniref:SGNH hydrolase-type esterase domain-containing protein n=1 Tax=Tenacibaculum tangerinum TaxID=3038772 RepID=A0ABY8L0J9_9FLAO|nr:hypothetical protein [Tenacibaculum tangerinum]WGH74996.1 hypothetical protein P8625_13075 [Tenacibaculum tangerinum]
MNKCIAQLISILLVSCFIISCSSDSSTETLPEEVIKDSPDINKDGKLNILVIGTSKSITYKASGFSPNEIATQLSNILSQDTALDLEVNISFEDIYKSKQTTYLLGQDALEITTNHYIHSLMQYYYWPEGQSERLDNIAGKKGTTWDYVVIASDPFLVSQLPGYNALGVNKIASKVAEGGAKPLLLMVWPKDETVTGKLNLFEEFTYRIADHAKVYIDVIPAGLAWNELPASKKDTASEHPTPNGAYVTAASIYAQIVNKSAASSDYTYDDEIADLALKVKTSEENATHYTGERTFVSPFKGCFIDDSTLNYNHTGTSTENGILNGLKWIIQKSDRTLVSGGTAPINFNYGRANTNFEAHKRYKIDPTKFDYSFGFPMQDHGLGVAETTMLYGIDKRSNESHNGTDIGTALYMIRNSELPHARAIPVRSLYAQIKEIIPSQTALRDEGHLHTNIDKAIGAFMYTLLTGDCVLGEEPADKNSTQWKEWVSHKVGYETAYTLMTLKAAPNCN